MKHRFQIFLIFLPLASLIAKEKPAAAAKPISFYDDIRPVFQARCNGCHQPAKDKGGFVMTDFKKLVKGGDSGDPAIVPGKSGASLLVSMISPNKDGKVEMPSKGEPLHETEVALIRKWIDAGAGDDTPENVRETFTKDKPPVYTLPPVITSIDYSPDGQTLAIAGFHEVVLYKADGSGPVARLIGLSERIESVQFSPDGIKLAVAGGLPGRTGEIQVWDVEKQKLDLSLPTTYDTVYGVSWSPDGKHIAYGCGDNTLRAIDASSGKQVFFQGSHNDWVFDTTWSPKGDHIISVGRDRTAKLSEFKTERFVDNITSITPGALAGGTLAVVTHPMQEQVLVGGADGIPKIYKIFRTQARKIGDDYNLVKKFDALKGRVYSVDFNSDGTKLVAGSSLDNQGALAAYQEDGKKLWSVDIPAGVYSVVFSPDNKAVAAAGTDGIIRLLDPENGKITKEFLPVEISQQTAQKEASAKLANLEEDPTDPKPLPKGYQVEALFIEPAEIAVNGNGNYAQLILSARLASGDTVDVTRLAKFQVEGGLASVTPRGTLNPNKDGEGKLVASYAGKTIEAPLRINGVGDASKVDFIRDVAPVLSKAGCNQGTCHGAKDGRNGFKLSLRGYDPIYDVRGFTDDIKSRRANVASPDKSLMLLKATGAVPHEGHQVFKQNSKYYGIIRKWIGTGAKLDLSTPRVKSIRLFPENPVVQDIGTTQQIRVVASYSDGLVRDVTSEAFVSSGNTEIVTADRHGLVTTLRRGEAPLLARFEGAYASTTVTVMGNRQGYQWKEQPAYNPIDKLVAAKWKRMKILPSDTCTDIEFVRRVHLDLTGLPPSAEAVKAFDQDQTPSKEKREALIDKLIGSDDFIDHWTNKWADLLQVNRNFLGTEGAKPFRDWIRNEIAGNTPYDQFVRKILTASGSNKEVPQASYFKILRKPEDTMENTTHLFLATRFNCNKCHDHPFERWTMDQYYQLSAFFVQTDLKKDPAAGDKQIGQTAVEAGKPIFEIVFDKPNGEMKHERTGETTPPEFPYPAKFDPVNDKPTRREQLAAWMTSPDNRYFALSYANRVWGYLTGTGVIEPIDDIRAGNPPTNPELLDFLTKEFIGSGFDVRELIRTICKSRTYQLSVATHSWNYDDNINYSHAKARRLPAEVLFDSIYSSLGATSRFPGVPAGTRAAQLPDAGVTLPDGFLGNLGRPPRESACECERSGDLQLGPVMALISGPTVNDAISDPNNAIAKLAQSKQKDEDLVTEIYLRLLNRYPSDKEMQANMGILASLKAEHDGLEAAFAKVQKDLEPELAKKEAARQDGIAAATKELNDYKASIADREKKAEDERQAKIKSAKDKLADYDKTLPDLATQWEADYKAGKSPWQTFKHRVARSSIKETNFETKEDGSIMVSGKNGKADYTIRGETPFSSPTGIRIEAIPDKSLPGGGSGRAGSGNFVLSELEVIARPTQDLQSWESVKQWDYTDPLLDNTGWDAANGAVQEISDASVKLSGQAPKGVVTLGNWHHAGAFEGVGFDQNAGPEGEKEFDAQKKYKHGDKEIPWVAKPEWKDGTLYGTVFNGDNSANYLARVIEADNDRSLPISLGSDDGIKVFLNGKVVHANNVGRAAEPDQEKVTLNLVKGKNLLLLKIHNGGGPSGFYFNSDAKSSVQPAIITKVDGPKGSYVVEVVAKSDEVHKSRILWSTKKENSFDGKRATKETVITKTEIWKTVRFEFVADDALTGIQFEPGGPLAIQGIRVFRHEAPVTLAFENALATFSQNSYDVGTAVDGKVAPTNNGWAISPDVTVPQMASFQIKQALEFKGGTDLTFVLKQQFQDNSHSLGRFRLSVTDAPKPVFYGVPKDIQQLFEIALSQRKPDDTKKILEAYKKTDGQRLKLQDTLTNVSKPRPKDPKQTQLEAALAIANEPLKLHPKVSEFKRAVELSRSQLSNPRLTAAQDLAWALINNPAFLFNY
jgi:WD40 repeat protein